jgi:predicted secreted protein
MGERDADDVIRLQVGEEKRLKLSGQGTAGYRWQPEIDGDDVAEISRHTDPSRQGVAMGASADEVFTLKAKRKGRVRVRFAQRRPWEGDAPPVSEHVVDLSIDD